MTNPIQMRTEGASVMYEGTKRQLLESGIITEAMIPGKGEKTRMGSTHGVDWSVLLSQGFRYIVFRRPADADQQEAQS